MCETPLAEAFKSPATAPEKELHDVDHTFARRPQEEGRCSKAAVSLDYKTKVIKSSRTWRRLSEVSIYYGACRLTLVGVNGAVNDN